MRWSMSSTRLLKWSSLLITHPRRVPIEGVSAFWKRSTSEWESSRTSGEDQQVKQIGSGWLASFVSSVFELASHAGETPRSTIANSVCDRAHLQYGDIRSRCPYLAVYGRLREWFFDMGSCFDLIFVDILSERGCRNETHCFITAFFRLLGTLVLIPEASSPLLVSRCCSWSSIRVFVWFLGGGHVKENLRETIMILIPSSR